MSSGNQKLRLRWTYKRNTWMSTGINANGKPFYKFLLPCMICRKQMRASWITKTCDSCKATYNNQLQAIRGPATAAVQAAMKLGQLPRLNAKGRKVDIRCVDSGKPAEFYDHRDYSRPLDVEPVCPSCNSQRGPAIDLKHLVLPRRKFQQFN